MNKFTFSKWLVVLSAIVFVAAFVVATVAVLLEASGVAGTANLDAYLAFSGATFTAVTSWYTWKAKNENMNKYTPGKPGELIDDESEDENDV